VFLVHDDYDYNKNDSKTVDNKQATMMKASWMATSWLLIKGTRTTDALIILLLKLQTLHACQGTHITDASTSNQIQGMHTSQGTHITDASTISQM
jgi:hypothetical protein